ncbi:MAG TPA: hypothetical protein VE398_21130, partial [Acidobacteriota bacterium]|nr:hypothetical protein [Acidobacteriota bacterium]
MAYEVKAGPVFGPLQEPPVQYEIARTIPPGLRLGACPRIRRGRAHGACTASARREEEAMSVYIVDDEQR